MKFLATVASAAFLLVGVFAQQNGVTVNSLEGVTVCRPSLISWSGGTPPYFLSILPANQPNAQPLVDFGRQTSTSVTWLVNLPAGTAGYLSLRDNTGAVGQSAPFTVATGSDTSCLSKTLSVSSGPEATGSTGSSTTASGASVTTASKTSTSTRTAVASPSAAAAVSQFNLGAAAVLGAAVLVFAA